MRDARGLVLGAPHRPPVVDKRLLNGIKNCGPLTERLATLKEFHMEFVTFDSRSFLCSVPDDLNTLYSAGAHELSGYEEAMTGMVNRLASLFASLNENPSIRFRAGRSSSDESAAMRELLAGRLAGQLSQRLIALAARLPDFPASETCDLLILDRSVDPVAPVVHDWSYEHLCHDVLRMRGPLWRYAYTANSGRTEDRDVSLDESDALFAELRCAHVADVLLKLSERAAAFGSSNARGARADVSVSALRKMVESLPQYREQLAKLTVHSTAAEEINAAIRARRLNEIGKLEQDLIFGDATSKDLTRLLDALRTPGGGGRGAALAGEALVSDRLRLLMCYFGTHAEKMDGDAGLAKWKAAAQLAPDDMGALLNLELLGCSVLKRPPGAPRVKKARRRAPLNDEGWDLPSYTPRLAEVVADLARGTLSQEAFPFVNPPVEAGAPARSAGAAVPGRSARSGGGAVRSARAPGASWAKKGADGLPVGDLRIAPKARRLVVFLIGPVAYNELRVAHEMSASLGRDVFLGATSVVTCEEFIARLKGCTRRNPLGGE